MLALPIKGNCLERGPYHSVDHMSDGNEPQSQLPESMYTFHLKIKLDRNQYTNAVQGIMIFLLKPRVGRAGALKLIPEAAL